MADNIILPPNSKAIPLTKGFHAIVDAEDYDWLMQRKWCFRDGYAAKTIHSSGSGKNRKSRTIKMHRIVNNTPDGMSTDHINGDKLDNRKCNLRVCTHRQNLSSQKKQDGRSSKYKGVSLSKENGKWIAYIKVNQVKKHLGCFTSEEDAARAYNTAATKYFGEFAKLNIIE